VRARGSVTDGISQTLIRFLFMAIFARYPSDLKHLMSQERLPFSLTYFGSLGLTLYFAIGVSVDGGLGTRRNPRAEECSLFSFHSRSFSCFCNPHPYTICTSPTPNDLFFPPTFEPSTSSPNEPAQNNNRYPPRSNRPSNRSSSLPRSVFPWWFDDITIRWTDG
jgi:hypothetical protein